MKTIKFCKPTSSYFRLANVLGSFRVECINIHKVDILVSRPEVDAPAHLLLQVENLIPARERVKNFEDFLFKNRAFLFSP